MLVERDVLWFAQTNCWVLARGRGEPAILVDAPPDLDGIGRLLAANDLVPEALLVTHGHVDHAGAAGHVETAHGISTWVHPDDDFLTLHPLEQVRSLFGAVSAPGDYRAPTERIDMTDGQVLELAGFRIHVRHTPGHTPGHVCLEVEDEGILFSGDQLFAGSIGRTDLPGGDAEALFRSMRRQVMTLPDEVRVLPGHGPDTTVGHERRTNPFRAGWA